MTTIGTSSLYSGTINGLNSLDLDTLNVTDLDVNNIDGEFFSINTIECNDLQVDNELDLTANGFIKIGKNTATEITITDTELGYLDGISSNIQDQLDTLSTDLNTAETDIDALETKTQNLTATSTDNTFTNSTTSFKDAPVDNTITNVVSSFTHFDKNIALMRTANEYRKFWIGMTGDNTNPTNRFAIGCNGVNADEPEILMEIDATGEISMRNGLKIFDLLGNNVGTINNFQDSPNNSTFTIEAPTGNLFLTTPSIIDCWAREIRLGKTGGSTLWMRSDTANAYKSRIILDNLVLYGGLANTANDALIALNGEIQNHAYTDADHTAVQGIANIETDISTLQSDVATLETDVGTLQSDVATNTTNISSTSFNLTAITNDYNSFKANIVSRFQGGSYKMPFHVFKTTNGQIPFASAGHIDCFRMDINPGFSRNDLIYLKVCMRHQTTFNNTASPFTQQSIYRGYYDGVWILSPKEISAPVRRGTTPLTNTNTGNPISGGSGYGPDAMNTSATIGSFAELFYQETGSIVNGYWGGGSSNNVITFYLTINSQGQAIIIFRYLPITHTGTTPSTRNQSISGTIELLNAVDTDGGAVTTKIILSAYDANGGVTFNSRNEIDTI